MLREGDEAERFLDLLRMVRERDGLTFFAWALTSNHYHLGVPTGPVPLARTMGFVQSRFGQGYNRRWRSSGPLWQSRYLPLSKGSPASRNARLSALAPIYLPRGADESTAV